MSAPAKPAAETQPEGGKTVYCIEKLTLSDGSIYEGETENGLPHGEGKYTYPDGNTFTGTVAKNLPIKGRIQTQDGIYYEGEFSNGLPNLNGLRKVYFYGLGKR